MFTAFVTGNLINNPSVPHSCSLSDYERVVIILLGLSAKDGIGPTSDLE